MPKIVFPPALRFRPFALLWIGQLISISGSQMQVYALFWHIRELTDQPIAVSGIGLARFLPILLFSLFAGVVADMFDRRKVLFLTQSVMALVAFALAYLTWCGQIQLWHLYVLTAIQAIAMAFDLPARQSLTPNLVPREVLPSAFSLQSIAYNTGAIVGPALSGVVISTLGQEHTYLINALSFGAVLLALVAMGEIPQQRVTATANGRVFNLEAIREGVNFILSQPIILSTMILDFFATFFSSANTLLPFIARDVLNVGAVEYGWLSAAASVGAVGVGLVFSQRMVLRRQGQLMLWAVVVFGVGTIIFGLSQNVPLTMLSLIIVGGADTVSTIVRNTIRQISTPDHLRGRMVSINQIFFSGGPQLGEIEAGLVAQVWGTPVSIITGGVGCILAVVLVSMRWPPLRKYDGSEAMLGAKA